MSNAVFDGDGNTRFRNPPKFDEELRVQDTHRADGVLSPQGARPPVPARPRWVAKAAAGALVLTLAVGGAIAALANHGNARTFSEAVMIDGPVNRLVVDADTANINVVPAGEGEQAGIFVDTRTVGRNSGWDHQLNGDQLIINAGCENNFFGSCTVDLTVRVAPGTALDLSTDVGDITIDGITNAMALETDTGDIVARNTGGSVSATTDVGDIRVSGSPTSVTATTDTGKVDLVLDQAISRTEGRSEVGDVFVDVPDNGSYNVEASTGVGENTVNVPTDPNSGIQIIATSDVGDVEVF